MGHHGMSADKMVMSVTKKRVRVYCMDEAQCTFGAVVVEVVQYGWRNISLYACNTFS